MADSRRSDKTEKVLRFGCGGLLGAIVGGLSACSLLIDHESWAVIILPISGIVIGGLLAVNYGGRFWRLASKVLEWWS